MLCYTSMCLFLHQNYSIRMKSGLETTGDPAYVVFAPTSVNSLFNVVTSA